MTLSCVRPEIHRRWILPALALCLSTIGLFTRREQPVRAQVLPVTWRGRVAPVVFKNCTGCHHVGGSGPFDLTQYASARRWGPQMAQVTATRYMPPWLPEPLAGPNAVHFEGDRRMAAADIELIAAWVKAGMPEGDGPAPQAPVFSSGWQMGTPDLVVEMPVAVTEPASGSDLFVNFILPAQLAKTQWVRAMEIQPGPGTLVHHANVLLDREGSLRAAHSKDWQQGIPGMDLRIDSGDAFDPDSHFLFWKPDSTALIEPPGLPGRLDPGNDQVLNMHLKPTGKPETLRARIGLYFTPEPARAHPMLVELEHDANLHIPAGDAHFVVTDELKLPTAADLLGVYPHAHYLGHEMEAWATEPDGTRRDILRIRQWDIDRQAVYRLAKPLPLPAGTVVHMRYTYDNSAANIHNPHTPPVAVSAGNRAIDEMGHLWLQLLPHTPAGGIHDSRLPLEQAWMQAILQKSPHDPIALFNLGALEQMEGRSAQAATLFQRVLQQDPQDARARTALGSALEAQGDEAGARAQFQSVLAAHPASDDARFDLATLDLHKDRSAAAEASFRQLLAHQPTDVAAQEGLAEALLQQGRAAEAQTALRQTVLQQPDDPRAHQLLAMACSGVGDLPGTLRELREWARLAPAEAEPHRALAQVLSAANDPVAAVTEQKLVLRNATGAGDWNDLGVLEARAGMRADAREAFATALRLAPTDASIRANLERLEQPH